jgi:Major Facilitator Superfamily
MSAESRPSLRPFRAGLAFGAFNGLTWMIGLGTPMVLLAQQLGATAAQVGLASSFLFLVMPVQVLATSTLARLGYKRQMALGWGVRALFLLVPLAFALAAPERPTPWMVDAFVASVFGFCFFRAFGVAAHIPWFAAILPGAIRGRFFATDSALTSLVGVGTLLLCATLFARLPGWSAFAIVYGVAMAGSALAVASLVRLPSAPPPARVPVRTLHREARRLCLEPGPFRFYLGLSLLAWSATSSIAPFTTYYLKGEAGLPESRILAFTAAQFAGQIAGGTSIRAVIDRIPLRRFFQLAALGFGGVELFWLAHVWRGGALTAWLPLAYFAFGVAVGVSNTAHFTLLPELSDEERRPLSVAVFTATLGLIAGLAPIAWGFVLKEPGPQPGLVLPRFVLFFAFGAASNALLFALYRRLPETRSTAGAR